MVDSVTASWATKSPPRRLDRFDQRGTRRRVEFLAEHALALDMRRQFAGEGGGDHQFVEPLQRHGARGGVAQPPGRDIGQFKLAAEQRGRQRRQEAQHGARLGQAGAEPIGQHHMAVADGLHQAGHAEPRARVQFERIGEIGVEPAHQHLGALEAGDRAHEDAVMTDGQVLALDQEEPEIAREIGVLEIGFVQRPGREQADA